jgi:hypothetical protein
VPGKDDSLSFEPIAHYTYVVEGLGGPYFYLVYRKQLPWINDRQLTYYKKNGVECGNFVSGIEKLNQMNVEISISPNPSSDYTLMRFQKSMNRFILWMANCSGALVIFKVWNIYLKMRGSSQVFTS